MKFSDVSLPEEYKSSADFRFFLKWFGYCLQTTKSNTEDFFDLYDPLRCPSDLLWMLADTMGFKYDDRLSIAFNRLVLVYFMSMIRNKGSKDGVTLAAEVNLAQFNLIELAKAYSTNSNIEESKTYHDNILEDRLEDTSIPVNSVYVTPYTSKGYIDVVYFSEEVPKDACIEYVRPLGMYLFQYAGVRYDSRTKIYIDARLTNTNDLGVSIGPTHVGHYNREDYARMQNLSNEDYSLLMDRALHRQDTHDSESGYQGNPYNYTSLFNHTRREVYYRNSKYEDKTSGYINRGYRALYSLQLCNNEHIVRSLLPTIFGLGYNPQSNAEFPVDPNNVTTFNDNYIIPEEEPNVMPYNLRYDRTREEGITSEEVGKSGVEPDIYTVEDGSTPVKPIPAVNPIMGKIGDAIWSDVQGKYLEDESTD